MAENSQDFNALGDEDMVCIGDYKAKWKDVRNVLQEYGLEITYGNVFNLMVSTIKLAEEEKAMERAEP